MGKLQSCLAVFALLPALAVAPAAAQQGVPQGHNQHNVPVDADGALTWEALADFEVRVETPAPLQTIFHIEFPQALRSLDGEMVRLKGYMYPLETGETHARFLLSAFPPACPFCLPGSARTLVDVRCAEPLGYTLDAVMVEGRLTLLENDDSGLHYRLTEAGPVD